MLPILQKMLQNDPDDRPNFKELEEIINKKVMEKSFYPTIPKDEMKYLNEYLTGLKGKSKNTVSKLWKVYFSNREKYSVLNFTL